jgi:hypothetical protein
MARYTFYLKLVINRVRKSIAKSGKIETETNTNLKSISLLLQQEQRKNC